MVEHAETFLSLFAVDMDAALEVQPPDTWDSFPLFQLLNDFLRTDCMYYLWLTFLSQADKQMAKMSLAQSDHRLVKPLHSCPIALQKPNLTADGPSLSSNKCPVAPKPSLN